MEILKKTILFSVGGGLYVLLELMWRRWSHISMYFAGGTAFLLLGQLNRAAKQLPLTIRGLAGSGIVTAVELTAGLLVNRNYVVWDYRALPLNFMGQICLPFTLLWIPVSMVGMVLYEYLDSKRL